MDEVADLIKLYDALINHPWNNLKEEVTRKLAELDKAAGERLAEAKKKDAEEAAKGKGKPNA